jgi:hypothetical protein
MKTKTITPTLIAIATSATLLWGCDNQSEPVEPNPEFSEQAGETVEETVEATQETARKAVEQTQKAVEETGDRIESATD